MSHPISIGFAAWARNEEEHHHSTNDSSTATTSTSVSPPGSGFMSNATFKASDSQTAERDSVVTKDYYEALERFLEAKRIVLLAGLPQTLAANGFWGASDEDLAIAQKAATEGAEQALVVLTPEEAAARLTSAREALQASIPESKTLQPDNSSRLLASAFQRPVVLYHIKVTVNGSPVVELWKRYSQLEEVHEYLLTHPAKPDNLPEFPTKTWPRTMFSDKSEEEKDKRREDLEHWLKTVIASPLVLQSRFLYEKLEISETESNNLMQYGQYLRALEKQLIMAEAHQALQRPQQLLSLINNDYTLSQSFHHDSSRDGVLQFPHSITFGFPLPSRGAVVYGPDGKPWFSRKTIVSSVGSTLTATLELYNMSHELLATAVEQTTESGTRFQCIAASTRHNSSTEAQSIFLLEKAPKERVYFMSMSRTGEVIQCSGILEYWHKKSYAFTLPPSEEYLAVMSKNHNVVAGTRGVQISADQDVIAFLCAAWCLEHWNTSAPVS